MPWEHQRRSMSALRSAAAACALVVVVAACSVAPQPAARVPVTLGERASAPTLEAPQPQPVDDLTSTRWPAARVGSGRAQVSCERDDRDDPPRRLDSLEFFSLVDAMTPCQSTGLVRLQYSGRIDAGFTALVSRVAAMAQRMDLPERLLDIDSAGGHVEEAIRAGDALADTRWTVRVKPDAICHSACVLVLAAADDRDVRGAVGVHRLMRDRSNATSRTQLNDELRNVNALVRDYLERHGVALAVADLMMTVPNRRLRLLTPAELDEFGLQGRNAAQDDLDRIVARRDCGEDFVRRRDAFQREFEQRCGLDEHAWEAVARCGIALRGAFGFPDAKCPRDTPLADAERRLHLEDARTASKPGTVGNASTEGDPAAGNAAAAGSPR